MRAATGTWRSQPAQGPGNERGDQVAVTSGVKPDEDIVSSGQIKLKNGAPVVINNSVVLPNDPAPTPQEDHY